MGPTAEQAYLRTRLAILVARMRDQDDMRDLRDLPTAELLDRLGLEAHPDLSSDVRLKDFEQAQVQQWLEELSALRRPLQGPARDVIVQWARRYELFNLKAIIRGKIARRPDAEIAHTLFQLPVFLSLDHDDLIATADVQELLRRLLRTPYRNLAEQALRRYEEQPNPFLLDATLDQRFYSDLMARVQRLPNPDRDAMIRLVGRVIDRHNLVWLLRYRFNYDLAPAETRYLLIDKGLRLDGPRLHDMVNAETVVDVLQRLPQPLHAMVDKLERIVDVEHALQVDLAAHMQGVLRFSPSVLASVVAYLILRFYELRNVRAIVHARINGFGDDILEQALYPVVGKVA